MKTVWVLERGSYSDYGVVGIFSCKENAELIRDRINANESYDKATVVEWPIDPAVADLHAGRAPWLVQMRANGDTELVRKEEEFPTYEIGGKVWVWERSKAQAYQGKDVTDLLICTVWATDQQHAVKIANEYRVQMIADGRFK